MSTERETREVDIEGTKVVVKTYATGREVEAVQKAYFKGSSVEIVGNQPKVKDFNPAVQQDVRAEMIRQLVVSLDGNTENIADRCLDLPNDKYEELIAVLDEIAAAKKKT